MVNLLCKGKVCSMDIVFLLKNIKELACPLVTYFEHLAKGLEFTVLRKIKKEKSLLTSVCI